LKFRVSFVVPPGTPPNVIVTLLSGSEIEADFYQIDQRLGHLSILRVGKNGAHETIIVYAAGVWRSIADVGAFTEATARPEAPSEDPGRHQKAR
jgi:hypothetical protein